jgi:hypothetical protein
MGWLTILMPLVSQVLGRLLPEDPVKKAELELELQKAFIEAETKQIDVNMNEANHASIFVAGWRPFIGWVCGASFAYSFILKPILDYILILNGFPSLPIFSNDELTTVLMGMLGLGGLRTFDKLKGSDTKEVKGLPWLNKK